jgi:hypothetical protein
MLGESGVAGLEGGCADDAEAEIERWRWFGGFFEAETGDSLPPTIMRCGC